MKIGVMLRHVGAPGGIGVYTRHILNSLLRPGSRHRYFLIYRKPRQLGSFPVSSSVREVLLPAPSALWWDQVAVPRFARREGLDLIFNPKLSVPLVTRAKTVLVMHGAEQFAVPQAFRWLDRLYFTLANPIYCRAASAVICPTHTGARDVARYMRADPGRIRVIYDSYNELCRVLDRAEARAVQEKYSLPDRYILFIGGLSPLKNLGNSLRAYHSLVGRIPHRLVVVGFTRWKFSKDLAVLDELGLRDRTQLLGFVSDEEIPAIYNLADLLLFPSLYEGFGMPVLEAMACGCPVVTTETGCSPEVAGGAALLVDPYRPDRIADAVWRLLTDQALREELVEKGLRRAKEFSWRACAEETLRLFESLNGAGP